MLRLLLALAAAGGVYYYYRRLNPPYRGSTTNASDAVDDVSLSPRAGAEEHLDAAVMETFPASDPIAPGKRSETAWEREQRLKRAR